MEGRGWEFLVEKVGGGKGVDGGDLLENKEKRVDFDGG